MIKKILVIVSLVFSNPAISQQVEVDFLNTLSLLRIYKSNKSTLQGDAGDGGIFDLHRNTLIIQMEQPLKKIHLNYGLSYMANKYSFGVGEIRNGHISDPYYNIYEKYKCVALMAGVKKKWATNATFFCLSYDFFPAFIFSQQGYYSSVDGHENINSNRFGFSHIDSRLNMAIQFGKDNDTHFVFNWFFQPPSIYTGDYVRGKISSFNMGFGIGIAFDSKKNE